MSNIQITLERINSLKPYELVKEPAVRDKFINIWDTLWGEGTGLAAYERESIHFNAILHENEYLREKSTRFSLFTAFIDLAVCGLSLEPGVRALTYLITRNVKVNAAGREIWETRCNLTISGYGELVMRARCGQIRHADNPVLVYANDEFSFSDRGGRKEVDYVCHLPHAGQPVVACYLRITRTDGTIDYSVMTEEDWNRLAGYSAKQSSKGKANALYGIDEQGVSHIDTGFLAAKCIKHAFKTYPRMRIGRGTELQTEQAEPDHSETDYYGITEQPQPEPQPQPEAPFGNPEPQDAGVTVTTDEDDTF